MPNYPWLMDATVDAEGIRARMNAMRTIGVPYTDADIEEGVAGVQGKTEMDAMVAYLQVLGTMATLDYGVNYRD